MGYMIMCVCTKKNLKCVYLLILPCVEYISPTFPVENVPPNKCGQ